MQCKVTEDEITTAKEQLENVTQWLITCQNQAPFLFGIVVTNNCARVYIVAPVDVKTSTEAKAILVDEFNFPATTDEG